MGHSMSDGGAWGNIPVTISDQRAQFTQARAFVAAWGVGEWNRSTVRLHFTLDYYAHMP